MLDTSHIDQTIGGAIKTISSLNPFAEQDRVDHTLGGTIPKLLQNRQRVCPDVTLQACKNEHGRFDRYSYTYVYERVIELASALREFGVKRGDLVGIMADNRREWLITDLALLCLGAADVPRGCDSMGMEIRFILGFAECRLSFFENARQFEKVLENPGEVPLLKDAVFFDPAPQELKERAASAGITVHNFIDFEVRGKHSSKEQKDAVEAGIDDVQPDDIATVIFTSGTTGTPKGVMLTHDNYMAQCEVCGSVLVDAKEGDLWLTVLPIWHSFERAFCYMVMAIKGGFAYSKPVASLMLADMAVVRPQWMCAVPRLWEAVAQGIYREMRKAGGWKYTVFTFFINIGKRFSWARSRVRGLVCHYRKYPRFFDFIAGMVPFVLLFPLYALGEVMVYRKIRERLGGRFTAAISGGGSLQPSTDAFYHAIGFNLLEGYGMTETAPVLSVRNSGRPRMGCVGEVFPCAEIKVVAEKDGKIAGMEPLRPGVRGIVMARGRQIMKGYFKRPDLTAQIIGEDGWLNTGDLGMLSHDNEIKIVGRAKDTIVLLGGENIEPVVIENAIKRSVYIESAVVLGQDKRCICALIVPERDNILSFATENHIVYDTYDTLVESKEIHNLIQQEIDANVCAKTGFRACERIANFALLKDSFRIGAEISSKQELLRHNIASIYAKQIRKLFK